MVKHVVKGEKWACSTLEAGKNKPFPYITKTRDFARIYKKTKENRRFDLISDFGLTWRNVNRFALRNLRTLHQLRSKNLHRRLFTNVREVLAAARRSPKHSIFEGSCGVFVHLIDKKGIAFLCAVPLSLLSQFQSSCKLRKTLSAREGVRLPVTGLRF